MLQITKEITFDSAHRLLNHPGLCKSLHGHTYKLQVSFSANDLKDGMVCDFSEVKTIIEETVGKWDHAVILEKGDPLIPALQFFPEINIVILPNRPTAENMVGHIATMIQAEVGHSLIVTSVTIWETPTSFATWRIRA